jgi:hypothetical protein
MDDNNFLLLDSVLDKIKIFDVKFNDTPDESILVFIDVDGENILFTIKKNIFPFLHKENGFSKKISEHLNEDDKKVFLDIENDIVEKIIKNMIKTFIITKKMPEIEAAINIDFGKLERGADTYLIPMKIYYKEKEIEVIFSKYKRHRGIIEKDGKIFEDTKDTILKIYNDFLDEKEISFITMGVEEKIFSQASRILKDVIVKKFKETNIYKIHCLYSDEYKEIFK